MGVMESRAGGAGWDAERVGDLGWGIARVVVEHEDRPLLGRQASESPFELIPIGDPEEFVGCRRSVDRQDPQIGHATTLTRRLGDTDVHEQAMQPRVEPVRIAESSQIAPGDHQCVLEGILGSVDVAQDPLGHREQPVPTRVDQVDVCLPIAALCRRHEVSVHLRRHALAPIGGAFRY